ncbi:ATP-dependent 26S proteasome regulatory subunit [Pseudomonas fluorescens]|uniref:ATP-binding protein n=1 Tax=Pseudomonas fluorescens TaxID=294 RepID=UPI00209F5FE8|nr:ATP-binding protein [Pseudomonas fluorescens]MCP1489801.1 ATP-dependent 26S proteasome regulatory subunit [Pseudomonas fluorescens]
MDATHFAAQFEMNISENYLYTIEHLKRVDKVLQQYLHQQHSKHHEPDLDNEVVEVPEWLQARLDTENFSEGVPTHDASRLGQLIRRFCLSDIERDILLLALLPHFDSQYSWQFSSAQRNHDLRFPSVSFLLDMLASAPLERLRHEALFLPHGRLRQHDLIELQSLKQNDRSVTLIKVDIALYHFLIGHDYLPPLLDTCAYWSSPLEPASERLHAFNRQLSRALTPQAHRSAPRVTLKGPFGSDREQAVAAAAGMLDMPCLVLNLDMLAEQDDDALRGIVLALREVQLRNGCLLLQGLYTVTTSRKRIHTMLGQKSKGYPQPIITLQDTSQPAVRLGDASHIMLEMPDITPRECLTVLSNYLDPDALDDQVDLEALSNRFCMAPSSLVQTLEEAELYRRQRDPAALLSQCDLITAFKRNSQQNFGDLALRIQPERTFADLMVPEELHKQLNEVLMAIRHRTHALQQGFDQKLHYGLGISTLLHGPSGAGKTMAAEVLASALNVDLIKVDLSTVVNKYVGETEKHLAKIFDLAARDSGVLFFDEADALFGKRSETKDAQDRYANIEVSYLLQRLESHPGLVILSTNHLSHLDNAFTRRLTFIIKFQLPDMETRTRMWQSIWPKNLRIAADVDFNYFARIAEVSGANIRNVALLATWLAHEEAAQEISTHHIRHALQREMTKTGQVAFQ